MREPVIKYGHLYYRGDADEEKSLADGVHENLESFIITVSLLTMLGRSVGFDRFNPSPAIDAIITVLDVLDIEDDEWNKVVVALRKEDGTYDAWQKAVESGELVGMMSDGEDIQESRPDDPRFQA